MIEMNKKPCTEMWNGRHCNQLHTIVEDNGGMCHVFSFDGGGGAMWCHGYGGTDLTRDTDLTYAAWRHERTRKDLKDAVVEGLKLDSAASNPGIVDRVARANAISRATFSRVTL